MDLVGRAPAGKPHVGNGLWKLLDVLGPPKGGLPLRQILHFVRSLASMEDSGTPPLAYGSWRAGSNPSLATLGLRGSGQTFQPITQPSRDFPGDRISSTPTNDFV